MALSLEISTWCSLLLCAAKVGGYTARLSTCMYKTPHSHKRRNMSSQSGEQFFDVKAESSTSTLTVAIVRFVTLVTPIDYVCGGLETSLHGLSRLCGLLISFSGRRRSV